MRRAYLIGFGLASPLTYLLLFLAVPWWAQALILVLVLVIGYVFFESSDYGEQRPPMAVPDRPLRPKDAGEFRADPEDRL
jgi:hypothetical protein